MRLPLRLGRLVKRLTSLLSTVAIMWAVLSVAGHLRGVTHPLIGEPLPTVQGEWLTSSDAQPQLIYLFAPWCQICHLSMGNLSYVQALGFETQAYALSYQNRAEIEQYIQDKSLDIPVYLTAPWDQAALHVSAFPSYFIVKDGKIVAMHVGYTSTLGMIIQLIWHQNWG